MFIPHNSGQKVEVVTGSLPGDKIRQEVTGSLSQATQPSSGLSHATFMIPLHVPLGEYHAACLAGYVSACMHACM